MSQRHAKPLPVVASLWIGGDLSFLEQVCLKSFADHGHRTILYTYGDVGNVPEGVEVLDANTIFPNTNYILHKRTGSPSIHADAFRYQMIELQNVIWVDADVLCMRPWRFENQFVFGWEKPDKLVCNAVLGLPRFSKTLALLNEFCSNEFPIPPWATPEERERLQRAHADGHPVHVSELKWGVWGPAALTYFLNKTGEMQHVLPQEAFFPVSFKDRRRLLNPGFDVEASLGDGCFGVHLWNRRLRRRIVTHEKGIPAAGSFLGKALIRHDIEPENALIPDVPPAHLAENAQKTVAQTKPARPKVEYIKPEIVANNPYVTPDRPKAISDMALMRLQQSPEYQEMIDNLEQRTEAITGYLCDPQKVPENDKVLIVTSMKNEAPFILEWVAYYKSIGVTDFLVYTNDCSDNTNDILDRLQALGHLTRLDNPWDPARRKKPQHAALEDAPKQPGFRDADWVFTVDVDEFLNIHVGDGTFSDLLAAANYPNVMSFTWKFFGNGGVLDYDSGLITEKFTRCAPEFIPKPRLGWGFKSMVHKSAPYTKTGVHRPLKIDDADVDQVRWVNGSGRVMPDMLLTNNSWRSTKRSLGYQLATLNHYVLRSADSFLVKRERGRINHTDHDQGLEYWTRRNYASETDDRICARLPGLNKELAVLMADKSLAKLQRDAEKWHRNRIAELKKIPEYSSLYGDLIRPGQTDALQIVKQASEADSSASGGAKLRIDVAPSPVLTGAFCPAAPSKGTQHNRFDEVRTFTKGSGGFLWEGEENALLFAPKSRRLVVSFDNLSVVRTDQQRWPWAFDVLANQMGCSVLGVMAVQRNWFRKDFVHDAFERLRDSGFFNQFDEILFYGASMGGFGALVYAQCAPGANVLAIAPQSTLSRDIIPGEDRWGWTTKLDWSGRYSDVAGTTDTASNIFVIADPYFEPDNIQVSRIKGDNVTWLRTPFMGHQLPNAFLRMDILKPLLFAAAEGKLTRSQFYKLFRNRRDLPRYQHDLLMEAEKRGKIKLAIQVCEYTLKKREAGNIRRSLERLQGQLDRQNRHAAE